VADYEDQTTGEGWQRILDLRVEVNRALELARKHKEVGHSLDAEITLGVNESLMEHLQGQEEVLSRIFIVSRVVLTKPESLDSAMQAEDIPGLLIQVKPASAKKCARCWVRDESVGADADQPEICGRCVKELDATSS
jgi:isoleucyl-tRNA synthetase